MYADCWILYLSTTPKGISVGENSEATFRNITILDAQVGLAVKDWSRVDIRDSSIANSDTGLAIYQKKSEFGPALVLAYRLVFTDVVSERVIEEGSVFQLNGEIFSGTDHNLADSF